MSRLDEQSQNINMSETLLPKLPTATRPGMVRLNPCLGTPLVILLPKSFEVYQTTPGAELRSFASTLRHFGVVPDDTVCYR